MRKRDVRAALPLILPLVIAASAAAQPAAGTAKSEATRVVAVRAGRLIDPAVGTIASDQIILIRGKKFEAIAHPDPLGERVDRPRQAGQAGRRNPASQQRRSGSGTPRALLRPGAAGAGPDATVASRSEPAASSLRR